MALHTEEKVHSVYLCLVPVWTNMLLASRVITHKKTYKKVFCSFIRLRRFIQNSFFLVQFLITISVVFFFSKNNKLSEWAKRLVRLLADVSRCEIESSSTNMMQLEYTRLLHTQ